MPLSTGGDTTSYMSEAARSVLLVSLLSASVLAQKPDIAKLVHDLGSQNATTVAWAAHHARTTRDRQLAVPLQRALGQWRRSNDEDTQLVCLHLLDALIAHDAKVPAGELVALIDSEHCGAAAFVLLARENKTNQAELMSLFLRDLEHFAWPGVGVVDAFAEQRERRTLVIGDLLCREAPPGFVAAIAPRCEWKLQVTVHDRGGKPQRSGGLSMSPGGPRLVSSAVGWPPRPGIWFDHPFLARAGAQQIRIVPQLDRVATREEITEAALAKDSAWSFTLPAGLPSALSFDVRWLVAAGGIGAPPRLQVSIPYENDAGFVADAVKARRELQRCVDELRERFVARGHLSATDAGRWLPARIEVAVEDQRSGSPPALPALPTPE